MEIKWWGLGKNWKCAVDRLFEVGLLAFWIQLHSNAKVNEELNLFLCISVRLVTMI
jgi:hypothetical protein